MYFPFPVLSHKVDHLAQPDKQRHKKVLANTLYSRRYGKQQHTFKSVQNNVGKVCVIGAQKDTKYIRVKLSHLLH